jgi:hypothetical protein
MDFTFTSLGSHAHARCVHCSGLFKSDYVDVMDVYLRETWTTSSYTDCMHERVDKTNSPSRVQTHFDASRPAKRLYRNRRIHQNLFSDRDRVDLPLPGRPMIINTLDVVC